jgi:hypothetical protein
VVDNLRAYVDGPLVERLEDGHLDAIARRHTQASSNSNTTTASPRPLLFGHPMSLPDRTLCPAGGRGYTLNRAALKLFGQAGVDHHMVNVTDPREDVMMGRFFWDNKVFITDTRGPDGGILNGPSAENGRPKSIHILTRRYGIRYNSMSRYSKYRISFHLKSDVGMLDSLNLTMADQIYRYHAILNE